MADSKDAPNKASANMPILPEQSEFTFSTDGPAPPGRFLSNRPLEKPAQRLWQPTQALMREAPAAPDAPSGAPEIPVYTTGLNRPIAPVRSKESKNVERLERENAAKQQMIDKLKHTITEILRSGEGCEKLVFEQEKTINQLRDEIKENLEAKMADEKKLAEQEAQIADLQKRNEAAEAENLAANQATADMDELRNSKRNLEQKNEALNADIDSMRARLEAAEKKLTEIGASYRHAQITITNNNATIGNLERHIEEFQSELGNAQEELGTRDNRIRAKDDDLRDRAAEVANLNNLNKELQEENRRLISQNEKLELQAEHNHANIDVLRETSRDYLKLETEHVEAKAIITQLKDEIVSLEQSNAELRTRTEEYAPFPRTRGTTSNLESELSESDFHEIDEDTLLALNDPDIHQDDPEATACSEFTALDESAESQEVAVLPEVATTQVVIISPEATESPEVIQAPVVTSSLDVAQSPAVTQSPAIAQIIRINSPPKVIQKSHNPLKCWLQVYLDLWILFVYWFNHRLTESLGRRNSGPSSGSVVQDGRAVSLGGSSSLNGDAPLSAPALGDVASATTTTALGSTDHLVLKKELPNVWVTILALHLHVFFYVVIIVCVSNYLDVLHERSVWLSANEITRQYLYKFYKVPFKREYGIFHELFGPVRFLDVLQYNIHNWAEISRAFPG